MAYVPKKQTPIAVAYKKASGKKVWVKEFEYLNCPDKLITKRSKYLPIGSEIIEIGVGSKFYNIYKKKYDRV